MDKKNFEQAIKELEEIVQDLETGEPSLETAVKKFEEGIKLSQFCSKLLDETEKRITILLQDHKGDIVEKDFSTEKD